MLGSSSTTRIRLDMEAECRAGTCGSAVALGRADGRGLGREDGDVARVQLVPATGRRGLAVDVELQGVEAGVPPGGVPSCLADVAERVDEPEHGAVVAVGGELEPQDL